MEAPVVLVVLAHGALEPRHVQLPRFFHEADALHTVNHIIPGCKHSFLRFPQNPTFRNSIIADFQAKTQTEKLHKFSVSGYNAMFVCKKIVSRLKDCFSFQRLMFGFLNFQRVTASRPRRRKAPASAPASPARPASSETKRCPRPVRGSEAAALPDVCADALQCRSCRR